MARAARRLLPAIFDFLIGNPVYHYSPFGLLFIFQKIPTTTTIILPFLFLLKSSIEYSHDFNQSLHIPLYCSYSHDFSLPKNHYSHSYYYWSSLSSLLLLFFNCFFFRSRPALPSLLHHPSCCVWLFWWIQQSACVVRVIYTTYIGTVPR